MSQPEPRARFRRVRRGDLVRVRGHGEILATLDAQGKLEGLPFMPEMARYCGALLSVYRRVEKVYLDMHCYTVRMTGTVLLEDTRCSGSGHGGCQMGCRLLWKEAWLRPADEAEDAAQCEQPALSVESGVPLPLPQPQLPVTTGEKLSCQATELIRCTSVLPWWDLRQYARDLLDGERRLREQVRMILLATRDKIRHRLGLLPFVPLRGTLRKTPEISLSLQPGQWVQVKSREEIEATLDPLGRNRGLALAGDMLRFCGGTYRVARRVERAVVEWSGEIREVRNTVALEGVDCSGVAQRCCPRGCYHLWREIWLRRVPEA